MDKIETPSKFIIDKVLTISLIDKNTGRVVYTAPYDDFTVVLTGADMVIPIEENERKI